MEMPRKLTADEKREAFEIALNTPEALMQLETISEYESKLYWIAILWENSGYSEWRVINYEWQNDENFGRVPESAVFYPLVLIGFGGPEGWQVMVAVNLSTERAVLVDKFPARPSPEAVFPG